MKIERKTFWGFRGTMTHRKMVRKAARKEQVSESEFIRRAIVERCKMYGIA